MCVGEKGWGERGRRRGRRGKGREREGEGVRERVEGGRAREEREGGREIRGWGKNSMMNVRVMHVLTIAEMHVMTRDILKKKTDCILWAIRSPLISVHEQHTTCIHTCT